MTDSHTVTFIDDENSSDSQSMWGKIRCRSRKYLFYSRMSLFITSFSFFKNKLNFDVVSYCVSVSVKLFNNELF